MWLLRMAKYTAAVLLLLALVVNAQYTSYNPAGSATTVRLMHFLLTASGTGSLVTVFQASTIAVTRRCRSSKSRFGSVLSCCTRA